MSNIVPRFEVPFFSLFQNVFSFSSWKIYLIWKWELPIHKMFTLPLFLLLLLLVAASGRWNTWVEAGVGVEAGSAALLNINRRSAVHGTTHVLQWRSTRAWAHWGCGAESWAGSGELSSQLLDAACLSPAWTYAWAAAHCHSAHPNVASNVELRSWFWWDLPQQAELLLVTVHWSPAATCAWAFSHPAHLKLFQLLFSKLKSDLSLHCPSALWIPELKLIEICPFFLQPLTQVDSNSSNRWLQSN